jgi:hypothetical protein
MYADAHVPSGAESEVGRSRPIGFERVSARENSGVSVQAIQRHDDPGARGNDATRALDVLGGVAKEDEIGRRAETEAFLGQSGDRLRAIPRGLPQKRLLSQSRQQPTEGIKCGVRIAEEEEGGLGQCLVERKLAGLDSAAQRPTCGG